MGECDGCGDVSKPTVNNDSKECCELIPANCVVTSEYQGFFKIGVGKTLTFVINVIAKFIKALTLRVTSLEQTVTGLTPESLDETLVIGNETGFTDIIVNSASNPAGAWKMESDNPDNTKRIGIQFIDGGAGEDQIVIGELDALSRNKGFAYFGSISTQFQHWLNPTDIFSMQLYSQGFLISGLGAASGYFTIDETIQLRLNDPASSFTHIFDQEVLTASRVQTYQDADGVIALESAITEVLTFGGGASGDVATMTVEGGIITARTLVP